MNRFALKSLVVAGVALALTIAFAQRNPPTANEISTELGKLRSMPDDKRAVVSKQLALDIRRLTSAQGKLQLAQGLANLSTEGDFGRDTLQEVTTTLAQAVNEEPSTTKADIMDFAYDQLAALSRYEHMRVGLVSPGLKAAYDRLDAADAARSKVDFTLTDLQGKSWTLSSLKGKVVLVNFWATWCPPCRKEMPDLEALYNRFKDKGFVILAISDEESKTVEKFVTEHKYTYPMLLDPGRKVNTDYKIGGIPKSFIYDRNGKMVAQTIDMRTQKQFLDLLAKAGLK